jgi:hypothetical protein
LHHRTTTLRYRDGCDPETIDSDVVAIVKP